MIVYVPAVLADKLIWPVDELASTNPAGDEVNVPPAVPVTVGVGLAAEEQ
jgi:hypothetical protein